MGKQLKAIKRFVCLISNASRLTLPRPPVAPSPTLCKQLPLCSAKSDYVHLKCDKFVVYVLWPEYVGLPQLNQLVQYLKPKAEASNRAMNIEKLGLLVRFYELIVC